MLALALLLVLRCCGAGAGAGAAAPVPVLARAGALMQALAGVQMPHRPPTRLTKVLEKNDEATGALGGRMGALDTSGSPYRFEEGPSLMLLPDVYKEVSPPRDKHNDHTVSDLHTPQAFLAAGVAGEKIWQERVAPHIRRVNDDGRPLYTLFLDDDRPDDGEAPIEPVTLFGGLQGALPR